MLRQDTAEPHVGEHVLYVAEPGYLLVYITAKLKRIYDFCDLDGSDFITFSWNNFSANDNALKIATSYGIRRCFDFDKDAKFFGMINLIMTTSRIEIFKNLLKSEEVP